MQRKIALLIERKQQLETRIAELEKKRSSDGWRWSAESSMQHVKLLRVLSQIERQLVMERLSRMNR